MKSIIVTISLIILFLAIIIPFDKIGSKKKFSDNKDTINNKYHDSINLSNENSYSNNNKSENNKIYHYVNPYIKSNGQVVKGQVRKSISTNPKSYRNQIRSQYYYQTHKEIIKEKRKRKQH
ncbi:MAG: hypothetical protein OHK0036_10330 [Bacteroidia bacterium]